MISRITPKSLLRFSLVTLSSIVIALCVISAYLSITNLKAESTYNSATKSLINNIKASKKVDADREILLVSQKQVDDQFNEAKSPYTILLPHIKNSIEHNALISKRLTRFLQKQIDEDKKNTDSSTQSNYNDRNQKNNLRDKSGNSSLSDSQKKKVEDLLKQNNQKDQDQNQINQSEKDYSNNDSNSKSGKTKSSKQEDSSNKPW